MRSALVIDGFGDALSSTFYRNQTRRAWGDHPRYRTDAESPSALVEALAKVDIAYITGSTDDVMKDGAMNRDSRRLTYFLDGMRGHVSQLLESDSDGAIKIFAECWGAQAMAVLLYQMSGVEGKSFPIRQLQCPRFDLHRVQLTEAGRVHRAFQEVGDADGGFDLYHLCGQAVNADALRGLGFPDLKILGEEKELDCEGQEFRFASAWSPSAAILCMSGHTGYPILQKWRAFKRAAKDLNLSALRTWSIPARINTNIRAL